MENEQANQGIKEIKLLTVGLTGEYELLAWAEKITGLKAIKIYDPQDWEEMEPVMDIFGSLPDSIYEIDIPVEMLSGILDYLGYKVYEKAMEATGDDELCDYIPDLISQYYQVLHQAQHEVDVHDFINKIEKVIKTRELEEYTHYSKFQDYRMDVIQAKVGYQVVKMLEKKN